ncbi:MAG: NepR family anti-sigma factor [Pseudomonadota bacterium]
MTPQHDGQKEERGRDGPDHADGAEGSGDLIGSHLRRLFQDVQQEEIPDRFKELLQRLEHEEQERRE